MKKTTKINQFVKNSFYKDFFKNLIAEFKEKDNYYDFVIESKKKDFYKTFPDFKGVQIIRNKNTNLIYETSSHGNFSRDTSKEINKTFKKWEPENRWNPFNMNMDKRIVGLGWTPRSAELYNKVERGIDVKNLTPKEKVDNYFIDMWKRNPKKYKHPDNISETDKRNKLKTNISEKKVSNIINEIYPTTISFENLVIDRFYIQEKDPIYTPVFFKEVLKNHFKNNVDTFKWVGTHATN